MSDDTYSAADIAMMLGRPQDAGSIARTLEAFWPTVKAALQLYDKKTKGKRVRPRPMGD